MNKLHTSGKNEKEYKKCGKDKFAIISEISCYLYNAIIWFDYWHFQLSLWQELTTVLRLSTVFNVYFSVFFRSVLCCTLNAVPETKSLLTKSKLPLGIHIHPFRDLQVRISGFQGNQGAFTEVNAQLLWTVACYALTYVHAIRWLLIDVGKHHEVKTKHWDQTMTLGIVCVQVIFWTETLG